MESGFGDKLSEFVNRSDGLDVQRMMGIFVTRDELKACSSTINAIATMAEAAIADLNGRVNALTGDLAFHNDDNLTQIEVAETLISAVLTSYMNGNFFDINWLSSASLQVSGSAVTAHLQAESGIVSASIVLDVHRSTYNFVGCGIAVKTAQSFSLSGFAHGANALSGVTVNIPAFATQGQSRVRANFYQSQVGLSLDVPTDIRLSVSGPDYITVVMSIPDLTIPQDVRECTLMALTACFIADFVNVYVFETDQTNTLLMAGVAQGVVSHSHQLQDDEIDTLGATSVVNSVPDSWLATLYSGLKKTVDLDVPGIIGSMSRETTLLGKAGVIVRGVIPALSKIVSFVKLAFL